MKTVELLGTLLGALALFLPTFTWAAPSLNGPIQISMPSVSIMTCKVQGKIIRTNNVTNQITYTVSYGSNYSKANVPFTIYGTVDHVTANLTVYQLKGTLKLSAGEGNFSLNHREENSFTFPIKGNPGVTISATVNGVSCLPAYFKTVQSLALDMPEAGVVPVLVANPSGVMTPPNISGSATSSVAQPTSGGTVSTNNAGLQATNQNTVSGQGAAPDLGSTFIPEETVNTQGEVTPGVYDENGDPVAVTSRESDQEQNMEAAALDVQIPSESEWTTKDYVQTGLLGGVLVALITFMVMKYKAIL